MSNITGAEALEEFRTSKPEPLAFARNLMALALANDNFAGSKMNCHHVGLDSVVLFDDTENGNGMVRMFYAYGYEHSLDRLYTSDYHFTIGAHDHKYDIALIPVMGTLTNVTIDLDGDTQPYVEYEFRSGITGEMGVESVGWVMGGRPMANRIKTGESVFMDSSQVHTVQVDRGADCAWIVLEGPRVKETSRLFSPSTADLKLSSEGLYHPLDNEAARWRLLEAMGVQLLDVMD